MINPVSVVARAFRTWWDHFVIMVILNVVWFLLQLPLVTAFPATAVTFALARRSGEGEYWGPREALAAFREMFWPAWRWGLLNVIIVGTIAFNLATYWDSSETIWQALRIVWFVILGLWGALNLFYWPFWLAQEDKSMRTTYANCGRFLLLNFLPILALLLVVAVLNFVSVQTTVPFGVGLMVWVVLIAETAVTQSLERQT